MHSFLILNTYWVWNQDVKSRLQSKHRQWNHFPKESISDGFIWTFFIRIGLPILVGIHLSFSAFYNSCLYNDVIPFSCQQFFSQVRLNCMLGFCVLSAEDLWVCNLFITFIMHYLKRRKWVVDLNFSFVSFVIDLGTFQTPVCQQARILAKEAQRNDPAKGFRRIINSF